MRNIKRLIDFSFVENLMNYEAKILAALNWRNLQSYGIQFMVNSFIIYPKFSKINFVSFFVKNKI